MAIITLTLATTPAPAIAQVALPTDFVNEIVLAGFAVPSDFAFLPDGRILVTEQKTGRVRMVVNGHIATTDPVGTVSSLQIAGNEQGLLAIAIDPAWPSRPYVYLYYNRTGNRMRLARYTASGDLSDPAGENLTIANPLLLIDDIPDDASNHNGGSLRFDSGDHLFLSMGEDADQCGAQDSTALKGEILRLLVSLLPPGGGGPVPRALIIPPDNPLSSSDSNARLVWAYGLRNPFRFHRDPVSGNLYVADVGDRAFEELNEVQAGDNLGWPFFEGPSPHAPTGACVPSGDYKGPIAWYERIELLSSSIMSAGIYRPVGGAAFNWPPEYHGDVFFTDYYRGFMRRIKNTAGTWGAAPAAPGQPNATDWGTGFATGVEYLVGPDGSLYWIMQAPGTLQRIRYTGTVVGVPAATAHALAHALAAAPNPFSSRTELSFTLEAPARVRLAIHDVSGREIRRLHESMSAAGTTRLTWDGTNAAGRPLPAGVYLARLEGAGAVDVVRVLRVH